ncbi:MAG: hypothetical protein SWK76_03485 [Actinomycetota bacterium]|nr:hypothetical protein [Actinomycetota bacterium]
MKKGKSEFFVFISLLLLAVLLPASGCATGGVSRSNAAMLLFDQARQNIEAADSYRMYGSMNIEYKDSYGSGSTHIDYDFIYQNVTGEEPLVKAVMSFSSQEENSSASMVQVEMYFTERRSYGQHPVTGDWYYEEADMAGSLLDMGEVVNPQTLPEMLDASESLEVLVDNMLYTQYELVMDPEEWLKEEGIENMEDEFKGMDISEEDLALYMDAVMDYLSGMKINLTVEKRSGFIVRMMISFEGNLLEIISPLFEDEISSENATVTMDMSYTLTDYGKNFDIELPAEARDALPMEEAEPENYWEESAV